MKYELGLMPAAFHGADGPVSLGRIYGRMGPRTNSDFDCDLERKLIPEIVSAAFSAITSHKKGAIKILYRS
jgi:hypothetical protein